MPASLASYKKKRDFKATPEPQGGKRRAKAPLEFVIQKHAASRLHYDFRLELDGTLKSWAVPKGPSLDPSVKRMAVHVEDHPLDYASFEGVIPAGQYGAGTVIVWDSGTWEPLGNAEADYAAGKLKFALHGKKLNGHWMLVRMHGHDDEKQQPWLLIKERDEMARPASEFDVTEEQPDSVLSNIKLPQAAVKKTASKASPKTQAKPATKAAREAATKPVKRAAIAATKSQSGARKEADIKGILESAPKAKLPVALAPQLATLVDAPPTSGDWIYEIKFDGYRIVARIDGDDVRLFTRNGNDWTKKLTTLANQLRQQHFEPCWLDGEIVISDHAGRSDFQSLQNAFEASRAGSTAAIQYYLFDVPFYANRDLRALPLVQRRAVLASVLGDTSSELVRFSENFEQEPARLLAHVCSMDLEGLIGKKVDAPYSSSRNRSWIKLKCQRRQEFVIGGYTDPKGARSGLGALLLGVYDASGKLRYAGNVGTGFTEATLAMLKKRLDQVSADKTPFVDPPKTRGLHWVKPQLVGEVSFAEWTSENHLRHPVFHGLRADKKPESIKREMPTSADPDKPSSKVVTKAATKVASKVASKTAPKAASKVASQSASESASQAPSKPNAASNAAAGKTLVDGIAISHADRVIDQSSGLTKGDLVAYYQSIAPELLVHLKDRPVSMVRAPQGIAGAQMFQRHPDTLRVAEMVALDKALWPGHPSLIVLNSARAIVGAAQMNAIELHTWNGTTLDQLEHPDRMVFDLDPGEGLAFSAVIEATQLTVGLLDQLGLKSFLKTSGGKGMHVVVPVARRYSWDACRAFSEAVVRQLASVIPDRFVAKSGPKNRVGKVFVDFLRNSRGATTASAFSARARPGLGVSMTIAAAQLQDLDSASQWNIANAADWVKKRNSDPWSDYSKAQQQRLEPAAKKLGLKLKA